MKSARVEEQIIEAIRGSQTLCVVGHVRPDGDCIGSQLGLAYALLEQGKRVECWNEDAIPGKLAFLDPKNLLQKPRLNCEFDCVIATDCASFERLGQAAACLQQRKRLINIDHHASNTLYGDINWVAGGQPSTGELIYRLLCAASWPVTPLIANCLYTAISTDTGSFQYASTKPETHEVAGRLVEQGADLATISNEVYQSYPLARVRLLKHVYNHFRLTHHDQIVYVWLKRADYARTGAHPHDSEGLIDHLRAIQPVIVACVFEEMEPELTRVSFRSKGQNVDVNEIAQRFGGGGHAAAAGARIPGRPEFVQRQVIKSIKEALNAACSR